MGRKRTTWADVGGGGAKWLDNWKEEGLIKLFLHRDPGWERRVHSFRRVDVDESGKDGPVRKIKWLPFVCMETDDYHRSRGRKDGRAPAPKICPACRLIRELELADKLPMDEVVFEFSASRRDTRSLERGDMIGEKRHAASYKDDLTAKTEYLMYVIDPEDPTAVKILNEGYGFAKVLKQRIASDVKLLGDEDGDPSRTPICYTFEYDRGPPVKYAVSRFPEAKLTPEIEELWEGEPPDAEGFCNPGDPTPFYDAARSAITEKAEKVIDLDEVFEPALRWWAKQNPSAEEDASFDVDRLESEEPKGRSRRSEPEEPEGRSRRSEPEEPEEPKGRSRRSEPEEPEEPKGRSRRSEPEEPKGRSRRSEPEEPKGRSRRSEPEEPKGRSRRSEPEEPKGRSRRSEPEEPEEPKGRSRRSEPEEPGRRSMADEMGVEVIACPDCGADWEITSHDECPSCGCSREHVRGKSKPSSDEPRGERTRTRKF